MKKTSILALLLLVALGVCTAYGQKRFPRVVTDRTLWDEVAFSAPAECDQQPRECALKMLEALNINVGDSPLFSIYRLGEVDEKSVTVVFVSHKVTDDDSVSGILYKLDLSLGDVEDRSYALDFVGKQYQCVRGHKRWSKQLCP